MDFDALKTPQDGTVRDGAAFDAYLRSSDLIDSDHPEVVAEAKKIAGTGGDRDRALRLYYAVRDGLRYDPYKTPMKREAYRASATLATGHGYCVNKAGLMAALCRASGIPARVGYADVRNHMTTRRLAELMGVKVGDRLQLVSPVSVATPLGVMPRSAAARAGHDVCLPPAAGLGS